MVTCRSSDDEAQIKSIFLRIKNETWPILIHFGDEANGVNRKSSRCTNIYSKFTLVLRQYAYRSKKKGGSNNAGNGTYDATPSSAVLTTLSSTSSTAASVADSASSLSTSVPPSNVLQLPLGFMKSFLNENSSANSRRFNSVEYAQKQQQLQNGASTRPFNWAFIGSNHSQIRNDRVQMIGNFSQWVPFVTQSGISTVDMRGIYEKSRFVVVGRGMRNLDCFRIYEAIIAGAVPVVVGAQKYIEEAFYYEGVLPPFLFAPSWPSALIMCQTMSNAQIDEKRKQCVDWYVSKMQQVHRRITDTLATSNLNKRSPIQSSSTSISGLG